MSEPNERTVEASDFKAARAIWQAEMNTGPDPYADPAHWLGSTDSESDERRSE